MSRKFIAAILAATLTITTIGAQPAQAGNLREEDIAKLLAGAATIFIIGKAIESSKKDKKKKQVVHQPAPKKHVPQVTQQRHLPRVVQPTHYAPPPLPSRCAREVSGANTKYVMGRHCLNKHYTSARPLPRHCEMQFVANGKVRNGYSVRCLRHEGYRVAGWR